MKGKEKTVMDPKAEIPGRKYMEDKPWSCRYCYWWEKGKCIRRECYYLLPEEKEKTGKAALGDCKRCPYGKHKPCIGYCIAKLAKKGLEKR